MFYVLGVRPGAPKAKPVAKAPPPPQSSDEEDNYEAEFAPPKPAAKPAASGRAGSAPQRKITPAAPAAKPRPGTSFRFEFLCRFNQVKKQWLSKIRKSSDFRLSIIVRFEIVRILDIFYV